METNITRLKDRVAILGNHNQKFVRFIELHMPELVTRLEKHGKIDQVHLWTKAQNPSLEMDVVFDLGETEKEKLKFLGCYFAFQFIHLNLSAIDVLFLDLTEATDRLATYQKFMIDVGSKLRGLIASYMKKILEMYLPSELSPEFVICGVGTRTDQDDLDIGIIDDGSEKRTYLNSAVSKLSNAMFKYAVCMHMHLSEHVGEHGYTASIYEYRELLDKEIHDFVIISEMLNAAHIYGSQSLFKKFQQQITEQYYYHEDDDNRYHEGYLRGILGEVRSFLLSQMKRNKIQLKNDALRMIKNTLFALKTIFGIEHVNCWGILYELGKHDPNNEKVYVKLRESLTFLEIFRYLYQLYVVQEEEISFEYEDSEALLSNIAKTMGYKDIGVKKAEEHLLIHYYEYVQQAKDAISTLLPYMAEHLRKISIFSKLYNVAIGNNADGSSDNIAVEFVERSRFFRGTKFWDDLLDSLARDDYAFLKKFIKDLLRLSKKDTKNLIAQYVEWSSSSFFVLISLMVMIARNQHRFGDTGIFEEFNDQFLKSLTGSPDEVRRITAIFSYYPNIINDYLYYMPDRSKKHFSEKLNCEAWDKEVAVLRDRLLFLCQLHLDSSLYFKRFLNRVVQKNSHYIHLLDDVYKLQQITKGLYGEIDRYQNYTDKKEKLGEYFDVELLRVGLMCLTGAPVQIINQQFTEFSDTYIRTLFDICKAEVDGELGKKIATKDLLAIFVAGGHAREQAFVDDWDMLFLLDSDDEHIRNYGNKIASRMNSQITRRAILPHYRLADVFGHYVTKNDELYQYLSSDSESVFIDKSQVLGSRMIVGSHTFLTSFYEKIITPNIFDRADEYIKQMIKEIHDRHRQINHLEVSDQNVKEGIGGLRDIEMTLLIYKAKYKLHQPITVDLFYELRKVVPEYREEFTELMEAWAFFETLRDTYRLTASLEDELQPEYLQRSAYIMGFKDDERSAVEKLMYTYQMRKSQSNKIVQKVIKKLA